jgi:hypothetical protein
MAIPRWTSVHVGASFVPCCDLCGWIGKDRWTEVDANRACRDHARTKRHMEDAQAYSRAMIREATRKSIPGPVM